MPDISPRDAVRRLWPELDWITDQKLREQTTNAWVRAFELSPLEPDDLNRIPFTLLIPNCPVTFMEHKRCVVHIARKAAESMHEFMGKSLPIHMDTVIAGAIWPMSASYWNMKTWMAKPDKVSAVNFCGTPSPG